jgi:diguanylate cyclase (GGDEF)-like protein/PAS domain S-box-containing protein
LHDPDIQGILGNYHDITERKQAESDALRNESRLRRLVAILQRQSGTIQDFLDYSLEQAIQLSESKIGFICHYHEDRQEFVMNSWSKEAMPSFAVASPQAGYGLDKAGIWGEAVRQRRPIIINDFKAANSLRNRYPEGHAPLSRFMAVPVFKGGSIVGVIGLANRITDYGDFDVLQVSLLMEAVWQVIGSRQMEDALQKSEERYRTVFQTSLDAISINRLVDGAYLDVNQSFLDIMGCERTEVIGHTDLELGIWNDPDDRQYLGEKLRSEAVCQNLEALFKKKNGDLVWGLVTASLIELDGDPCVLFIARDISQRKLAEEKINQLAFFDQLTDLPNRTLLQDRMKQAMASNARRGLCGALLFIDLDNFKTLNDTLGHHMGDLLLKQVAQRLSECVRVEDTVARLGGDEFVVMLASLSESPSDAANQVELVGEKIQTALNLSYQIENVAYRITSSIGASVFFGQQTDIDTVLKQADLAMYKAKDAGRNTLRFFDPDMSLVVLKRASLEGELREAVQNQQFMLHYQAQVAGNQVTGAEVLVRWQHPQRGLVSPAEFIPLAEETGLILPLGRWVLETACKQLAAWATRPEMSYLTIAVNVSVHQFHQTDFVDQVLMVLKDTGANPERLKLELTESLLVSNIEEVIEKMFALKGKGVGFSLDDFGTGYSSLSYLKRLPLDQLKIDQSFIRDVLSDSNDAAIARTIVALGQSLGLAVIAEGVETRAQKDFLADNGCLAYQGYFFSRPLPLEGFEQFAQRVFADVV